MSFDYAIKFILVGDTAVGKTSILNRFLTGSFDYNHEMTIGVEFGSKILTVNKQRIKLQVWDTAGQEEFRSITRSYYRSSAAALVVYDVSRRETFRSVRRWIEEVRNQSNSICLVLIANKIDLVNDRIVSKAQGQKLAKDFNMLYVQTSAKNHDHIDEAFLRPTLTIVQKIDTGLIDVKNQNSGVKIGASMHVQNPKGCEC